MGGQDSSRWKSRGVAGLLIVLGSLAMVSALEPTPDRQFIVFFGAVNLLAGIGLLRQQPGWRTLALGVLWLQLVGSICFAVWLFATGSPLDLYMPGIAVSLNGGLRAAPLAILCGLYTYGLWALRRPKIEPLSVART